MVDLIRINLKTKTLSKETVDRGHKWEFFAGRSLSSKIISDEVPPDADPLGNQNKLIIASGFLGGSRAPNSGRLSIGGKSPLTLGVKEANVGGRAPAFLANQGIRALILEDIGEIWSIIKVDNGNVEILNGEKYHGMNTYQVSKEIMADFGSQVGAFVIGKAGEFHFLNASIASIDMEGYPSRHAGRGGLGAVMGSKKVKAIVVFPPKQIKQDYQNPERFKEIAATWFKELYTSRRQFSKFGTIINVMSVNEQHGLPTQNFRRGSFEHAAKISGDALHEYIVKNNGKFGIGCSPGCAIQCSNMVFDANGNHLTSSLEYETIALNGSNLLISDLEVLAKMDQITDDLGMDSIETGNTLAVLMEAGILKWGDGEGVLRFLDGINQNKPESLQIGLGCYRLAKKLNISRVAHVKGQGLPGYEPRSFKGMGATFLTSPMGADHTAGPAILNRKAIGIKEYGKLYEPENKVDLSRELQIIIMFLDSMGLCYFVGPSYENAIIFAQLLQAKYGWEITAQQWIEKATEWLKIEHEYNKKVGIETASRFPDFIRNEPLEEIDRTWDIKDEEIDTFWDKM